MAVSKKNNSTSLWEWLIKSWETILKLAGAIIGIFLFGFKIGTYYEGQKFELEKMKLEQTCNERLHQLENKQRDEQSIETKAQIKSMVEMFKTIQNDKK